MEKKEKRGVCPVTKFPEDLKEGILYCKKRDKDFSSEGFVPTSHSLGDISLCERKIYRLKENGKTHDYISCGKNLLKKAV
ncbi:MAG: hypothetical protein DLD55_02210 [candidate division SR1 bacterium]|nr:MAG: hypothetical protein DLD55_02210 [candidate division SR1 bacterium]